MMKKLRATKGTYFYVPKSYYDNGRVTVIFRALSHGELLAIENLINDKRFSEANYRAVEFAVIKVEDNVGKPKFIEQLPLNVITEVAEEIFYVSGISNDEYVKLSTSLDIHLDPTYQTDTWKCSECQRKRLDRVRNCGFRGEKNKDPEFVAYVNNHPYSYCPIYDVDKELLSDAMIKPDSLYYHPKKFSNVLKRKSGRSLKS